MGCDFINNIDLYSIIEHDLLTKGESSIELSSDSYTQEEVEEAEEKLIKNGYRVNLIFAGDAYIIQASDTNNMSY